MTKSRLIHKINPTLIVFVTSLIFLIYHLSSNNWNPFSFILIGGKFDPRVNNQSYGYDGQFAYQIAKDPLNAWRYVDVPAYRYQRILYPILARALSFGNPNFLPWMLIFINWSSLLLSIYLLEKLLQKNFINKWYALSYGLYQGVWVSLRLDLTEILAYLLVICGILAIEKKKIWYSSIFFALALLAKEVTLIFIIPYFLSMLLNKKFLLSLKLLILIMTPFVIWQSILLIWFGEIGIRSGGLFSTPIEWIPYRGWWSFARIHLLAFVLGSIPVLFTAILPSLLYLVVAIRDIYHKIWQPEVWILLFHGGLIAILPQSVIFDNLGLVRTVTGLVLALLVYGMKRNSSRSLNYSLLWIFSFLFILENQYLPNYP